MRTGFLFSWTTMLAVGLASAQTPGSSPAPAQSPSGQGAAAAPTDGKPAADAKAGTAAPPNVQGVWYDSGNGSGGRCVLLCGRPLVHPGNNRSCNEWLDYIRLLVDEEYLLCPING